MTSIPQPPKCTGEQLLAVACPTCGAAVGAYCEERPGKVLLIPHHHVERFWAAPVEDPKHLVIDPGGEKEVDMGRILGSKSCHGFVVLLTRKDEGSWWVTTFREAEWAGGESVGFNKGTASVREQRARHYYKCMDTLSELLGHHEGRDIFLDN